MTALAVVVFVVSLIAVGIQAVTNLWAVWSRQPQPRWRWWPLGLLLLSLIIVFGRMCPRCS